MTAARARLPTAGERQRYVFVADEKMPVKSSRTFYSSFEILFVLLFVLLVYTCLANVCLRLVGAWRAPYWFSLFLVGVGISLLNTDDWRVIGIGSLFGIATTFFFWFADHGAYHMYSFKWAYNFPWTYLLKTPGYAMLAVLYYVTFTREVAGKQRGKSGAIVFCFIYSCLMMLAPLACSINIMRDGMFMQVNYDVYGTRLGMFSIFAGLLSAALVKLSWQKSDTLYKRAT